MRPDRENSGQDRLNFQPLMEFCLGILGWTPDVFWHSATMADILAALNGWKKAQGTGLSGTPPDRKFMDDMIRRFPD